MIHSVVTDFFGIFFTLTWVFYSSDAIHGNFLGYFNIFGQIWMYKFMIATLLPVSLGLMVFFLFAFWVMYFALLCDPEFDRDPCIRFGYSSLWFIFGISFLFLLLYNVCCIN